MHGCRSGRLLLRRVVVARLSLRLLLRLLLGILIAGLWLGVARTRKGISLRRLLRIIGHCLRARRGVQAVAASVLTVALRWGVVAGGVLSIEKTACHLAHALAKFRQKLQRAFILRLGLLLRIAVALWCLLVTLRCLLIARRRAVLLRITTLLWITLLLRIVALLSLRHARGSREDGETPAQSNGADQPPASGLRIHNA